MRKGKILWGVVSLVAVCLLLCACPPTEPTVTVDEKTVTVIYRDEDGTTELHRATYKDGENAPAYAAPEKEGKTFENWNPILDEETMKVYQASYAENPTPTTDYPKRLDNGITVLGGTAGVDGQNCENLFDGNNATVWCVDMSANTPAYVEWSTPSPVEVYGVGVATAEDDTMNPEVWRVYLSDDGQNWGQFYSATSEDNRVKEAHLWRGIGIVFFDDSGETYTKTAQYFRLEVEQTRGNSLLKLAEFGILTEPLPQET